jgi:formin-binding protein 1
LSNIKAKLREVLRERVNLEREYATKLQALSKKTAEKKSKRASMLVLGDNPSRVWDAQTLHNRWACFHYNGTHRLHAEASTLNVAYSQFITFMESAAQDHFTLADGIVSQVIDPLKLFEQKQEVTFKKVNFVHLTPYWHWQLTISLAK